jgi:hypothetical protein
MSRFAIDNNTPTFKVSEPVIHGLIAALPFHRASPFYPHYSTIGARE